MAFGLLGIVSCFLTIRHHCYGVFCQDSSFQFRNIAVYISPPVNLGMRHDEFYCFQLDFCFFRQRRKPFVGFTLRSSILHRILVGSPAEENVPLFPIFNLPARPDRFTDLTVPFSLTVKSSMNTLSVFTNQPERYARRPTRNEWQCMDVLG